MSRITDMLSSLGGNIVWIIIGCVELVAAIIMISTLPKRLHLKKRRKASDKSGAVQAILDELDKRPNEVCYVTRSSDLMPMLAYGDLIGLMGVTVDQIRTDASCLFKKRFSNEASHRILDAYHNWNGKRPLRFNEQTTDGKWIAGTICRDESQTYDLIFLADHTEQHQQQEEYEKALDQADASSQLKTSFLFRMSHEIRTPMNGIAGMLTLAEDQLTADHPAMQYLTKADELSDHLLKLINNILDMSRIEAGKVELENLPFSLHALGNKLYDMFSQTLETKGVHYEVIFEPFDTDWVVGDELRISQVVINFLSNAIKFTSEGEVTVTFRQMLLNNGVLDFMIRVHDTGIGMKPEFNSRIFRPFEQEDASTTRRFGGTGLGMAISDQLVKLMGGQIVVNSQPQVGSDFSVFLSLPVADEAAVEKETGKTTTDDDNTDTPDRGCRLLLAEDNDINAMIAVEILGKKGAEVDVAENGQVAVDRFASLPEGYYDAILMDIQMPVMDGRAAAKAIRAMSRSDAKRIPIFALSADAFVEDERLSRESGMNGHLAKPINFDELWKTLQKALSEKEER